MTKWKETTAIVLLRSVPGDAKVDVAIAKAEQPSAGFSCATRADLIP